MKVLIVTLEYPPQVGGIASYVYNFTRAYSKTATCVVYAPFIKNSDLRLSMVSFGREELDQKNTWKVYRRKPFWKFIWPHWLRMALQLYTIARKEKPDTIHIHQVLPGGYVTWFLKKYLKIPYTIFLHGSDVQYVKLQHRKIKKFAKVCLAAQQVVVNSHFLEQEVKMLIPSLPTVQVIYPSPGEQFFTSPSAAEIIKLKASLALEGKKVMITVARLVPGKGHMRLIQLLPQLLQKIPNLAWVVVGDGGEQKAVMKALVENQLQSVVRMVGAVDSSILPVLYRIADVFVLLNEKTDTTSEGFGTVFLEAALCGLPVVATDVGGVKEAVVHLQTGIVVDPRQDEAIVSSIAELLHTIEYAKKMGEAGRQRVLEEFTWEKQLEKLKY